MKKRLLIILLALVLGAIAGASVFIILEYSKHGGDIEQLKDYIKNTVIPSVFDVVVIILGLYLGVSPIIKNVNNAADGFISSKVLVGTVSEKSTETNQRVEELNKKLRSQITSLETLKNELVGECKELAEQVKVMQRDFRTTQRMIAVGFGNTSELVKNGYARKIYQLMEASEDEKSEG